MNDPNPYTSPIINTRPSRIDALKAKVTGPTANVASIIMVVMTILGVIQTYQETQKTAEVSYETLRQAVEKNSIDIAICRQEQINSQGWIEDIVARLEKKQETTDKAIPRKAPRTPPTAPPIVDPSPKPPVAAVIAERTPLPTFESLK